MYKYELHMHTKEGSACGKSSGAEMVEFYLSHGYSGAVVTDHFYHGNTAPARNLAWHDFIAEFAEGYRNVKKAVGNRDFDVFFGIEERLVDWSEFIVLGLEPEWYAEHPELRHMDGVDFLETVRGAGAFVIQVHPFRERTYMQNQKIYLLPDQTDAIEVRNCGNLIEFDRRAYEYAKRLGKPMTGGSDNHIANEKPLSGIELPFRCHTVQELINAIKQNKQTVIDLKTATEAPLTEPEYSVITL